MPSSTPHRPRRTQVARRSPHAHPPPAEVVACAPKYFSLMCPWLRIPLPGSADNSTKEQVASHDSKHVDHHKNSSVSSMVVSVLIDPREAGDGGDVEGMMGPKSFSRIFVVVLLDSVKYVTYSCMLPLKGASHLVTA